MSDLFQQQSPLVQIDFSEPRGAAPAIEERPFLGYINLRGRADNTAFLAAVLKVLGSEPPTQANTVIESGDNRIFWLGHRPRRPLRSDAPAGARNRAGLVPRRRAPKAYRSAPDSSQPALILPTRPGKHPLAAGMLRQHGMSQDVRD